MVSKTIVDCHSHIFNAEDLPIDGFIKELAPVPRLLTAVVSVPLDRLTQWVALSTDSEAERLVRLLSPGGLEAGGPVVDAPTAQDLLSDEELDQLLRTDWENRGLVAPSSGGLEAGGDPDADLAAGLANANAADREELDRWLREWGHAEFDAAVAEEATGGLEGGFRDWYRRVKAAKQRVRRFVDTLGLVTGDRAAIAADIAATYSEVDLFVPALVDFTYTARDRPSSDLTSQVEVYTLLSKVAITGQIAGAPEVRVHSFIGFCPHREAAESELAAWDPEAGIAQRYIPFGDVDLASDADRYHPGITYDPDRARSLRVPSGTWETARLDLDGIRRSLDIVRHAIELGGFLGVKLYPPAGYVPLGNEFLPGASRGAKLDAALRSLYAYCEAMQVPILAHASFSNEFKRGYNDFAGPKGWEAVLAEYPDLRLCFGHFGHLHGVGADPANPSVESWSRRFVELVDQYPHVYTDVGNSKLPVDDSYRNRYILLLTHMLGGDSPTPIQTRRRTRVMYGSDYWMNTLAPSHDSYLVTCRDAYEEAFGEAALGQFMGANALRWLGITNGQDEPDFDNLNRKRLVEFYGSRARPSWLP